MLAVKNSIKRSLVWAPASAIAAVVIEICSTLALASSRRRRERRDPRQHATKQPPRQMTLCQQEPVVAGVFDQTSASFHQALLHAGQRPLTDPRRQRQPPPQIPEVVR